MLRLAGKMQHDDSAAAQPARLDQHCTVSAPTALHGTARMDPVFPTVGAGKRCIEIGCGPGLVASCLCRVGAKQLLLTDGDPQTLVNCISNLNLNGHGHAELVGSWREAVRLQETEQQPSDLRQQQQQEVGSTGWHCKPSILC